METKDTLKEVRALLANRAHWTTGAFARDADHRPVETDSSKAVSFCLSGAISAVCQTCLGDEHDSARFALEDKIGWTGIVSFNDNHDHREVLNLIDLAINSLED